MHPDDSGSGLHIDPDEQPHGGNYCRYTLPAGGEFHAHDTVGLDGCDRGGVPAVPLPSGLAQGLRG